MLLKTSPSLTTPPAGSSLPAPTPWPGANARLLGLGAGLPVHPLDRLASFGDEQFERFVFEWAHGFLTKQLPEGSEIQWRGGAGDKGRDIIALIGPPQPAGRPWKLFQCKHYAQRLGPADAVTEIGTILYYTWIGEYSAPDEMWFVTHRGVTNTLQDLVDAPEELRAHLLENWDKHCKNKITSKKAIGLEPDLKAHIEAFDFTTFRIKQPMDIVEEHRQTEYHLVLFGAPLVERPPPPKPPSQVAPEEAGYVRQLFNVIAEQLSAPVTTCSDFAHHARMKGLFDRSRLTFYCAEGLKELARDQMADEAYFDTLQQEFADGLYYTYVAAHPSGLAKLLCTIEGTVRLQLTEHPLKPLVTSNDRAGICHHLANNGYFHLVWGTTVVGNAHHLPRPFNTPLECGLRLLFVLAATAPRGADLQRLISYDYLLVHSGDVPAGPESLHPAVPFRGAEWLVRRDVVARGLDLMFARELVTKKFMPEGIFYAGNDLSLSFLRLLKTAYARELAVRASWIAGRFAPLTDDSLMMFMTEKVGRWGAEFDRLTALRDLEL